MANNKVSNQRAKWILLFGIAGMFLSFAGCGKENNPEGLKDSNVTAGKAQDEMRSESVEIPEVEGNYYEGEYVTIPETDAIEMAAVSDSAVYYLKYDQSEGLKGKIMKYDPESGQVTELPDAIPEVNSVQQLCVNEEGNLLMITLGIDAEEDDKTIRYWLRKIDGEGHHVLQKDLTGLLEEEEEETYVQYLKAGGNGHVYIAGAETVWVLDGEGNEEFRLRTGAWI